MSSLKLYDFFKKYELTQNQSQCIQSLDDFINSSCSNVFLLKGYAGTGKTFLTKGLTEYLKNNHRNFILAAPTGKASKVIATKTESEAYTIHKTIYATKEIKEYKESESDKTYKFYFDLRVNEDSNDTVYIFDEASMIANVYQEPEFFRFGSGLLLQDLFKYINLDQNDHNKKIIFIGDNAQLPPVGMSTSPALDMDYIISNFNLRVEQFELKEVVRQKSGSGILVNVLPIRDALENKMFNKLDIDTNLEDLEHVDHHDFINKYLQVCKNKINNDTIVIAYSNASVKEYNDTIREYFFKTSNGKIAIDDKIMVVANNSNHDIFLSNGDFGIITKIFCDSEHRFVQLKRKNKENGSIEYIGVNLYFRYVEVLFEDIVGIPHLIKCTVMENLLYSEKPSLSSDENKALYMDFVIRNPYLKPNTKEFRDTIKSDPYFNALKIKFGYAITCHKAQGSEWKNVFLNCKSHLSYLSQDYFRWLYTAITRSSNKLYTLDEPHFGLFDKVKIPKIIYEDLANGNKFLQTISTKVNDLIMPSGIEVIDIQHKQYSELYTFKRNNESTRIAVWYNIQNILTKIQPIETNDLSKFIVDTLATLVGHAIYTEKSKEFTFQEDFLEKYFNEIKNRLELMDIHISDIQHNPYMERYTFCKNDEIAIIDFNYNAKKQFTRIQPSNKSNSENLVQSILSKLQ
jgi:hypothetical protein